MTFNKKAGNLVKKAQNIMKRKENAWILTKKAGIPAFSWKFSCLVSWLVSLIWGHFQVLQTSEVRSY